MRQYLLGELSPEAQRQLEERAMTDAHCFEQLLLVEDELVDEYVCGSLAPSERAKFDSHFLSTPERHQKLRFAKSFRRYVSTAAAVERSEASQEQQRDSLWRRLLSPGQARQAMPAWSLATAFMCVTLVALWSVTQVRQLEHQLTQTQHLERQLTEERSRQSQLAAELQSEQSRRASLEQELASLKTAPGREPEASRQPGALTPALFSFALTPGLVRDLQGSRKVTIPPGASWVQLELRWAGDEYKGYLATLFDDEGRELWSQSASKTQAKVDNEMIVLTLPARLLPQGDYSLKLAGRRVAGDPDDLGKYYFRVIKR
ncbi:MAG: hypothetical protein L0387_12270 [Acidobacteria bacterium]|nr:hypothetical protein [Acidobacteriota bacterium]